MSKLAATNGFSLKFSNNLEFYPRLFGKEFHFNISKFAFTK